MTAGKVTRDNKQSGNVLFLILIAVALFAALSFAMTYSSRSGAGNANRETLNVAISDVLNHFTQVRTAVQRLILTGGCDEKSVRFWHESRLGATNAGRYGDGSDTACEIYHPNGGSVPYRTRPMSLETSDLNEFAVISNRIQDIGTTNNTLDSDGQNTAADLLIFINVPRDACIIANEKLGVENPGGNPPQYTISTTSTFRAQSNNNALFPSASTGGYAGAGGVTLGSGSSVVPELRGKSSGCFHHTIDNYYTLYSVLIER